MSTGASFELERERLSGIRTSYIIEQPSEECPYKVDDFSVLNTHLAPLSESFV